MTDVSHIITQGIGTPAAIPQFILVGLSPVAVDIAFVDSNNAYNYGSSITLTLPSYAEDDLLLAFVGRGGNGAEETWDDDGGDSNGWTKLVQNFTDTGRDEETAIYYKIAGASESNPTFTHGSTYTLTGLIASFRNVDTSTPFDVTYNNGSHYAFTENDSTPTPQAITTATNGAWVLVMSHINVNDITAIAAPTNYDLRESLVQNNGNIMLASRAIASAGTETPGAWTNTAGADTGESHSYTLALKPTSGGAPPVGNIIPIIVYHRMLQGIQ